MGSEHEHHGGWHVAADHLAKKSGTRMEEHGEQGKEEAIASSLQQLLPKKGP